MKAQLMAAVAASALLTGCNTMTEDSAIETASAAEPAKTAAIPQATGYFAAESTLPFHAPDFTQISDADYKPAFEQALAIHAAEVDQIAGNPAAPTFENTIVALETSGQMLSRVSAVFYALTGSNTNDTLDAVDTEMGPKLSIEIVLPVSVNMPMPVRATP